MTTRATVPGEQPPSGPGSAQRNVFGEPLALCSDAPLTGWTRSGCCETDAHDRGSHTVCTRVTREFLDYSRKRGNDLVTPRPEFGFPGLKPGDRWCVCASRWAEAHAAGVAPPVVLQATHARALEVVPFEALKRSALDLT